MASTESIQELLVSLAKCVHNDCNKSSTAHNHNKYRKSHSATNSRAIRLNQSEIQRAKHKAYDVLLFRKPTTAEEEPTKLGAFDPVEELRLIQFDMSLTNRGRSERFAKCLNQILPDGRSSEDDGESMNDLLNTLSFLINMRDSVSVQQLQETEGHNQSGYGGLMRLPLAKLNNQISFYYNIKLLLKQDRLSSATRRLPSLNLIKPDLMKSMIKHSKQDSPVVDVAGVPTVAPRPIVIETCHAKCLSWDWLNVPRNAVEPELSFASESPEVLLYIQSKRLGSQFKPKMLTLAQFIADLKSLLLGIETESFSFDKELICFSIRPDVCLFNVTPETTAAIAQAFLECGSCCARLKMMCDKNVDFTYKFDGFIFKTLCSSVGDYLRFYEKFVDLCVDETVLALLNRMSTLMLQISQLAKMLAIHPDVNQNPDLVPCGSEFLGYLYKEITQLTNQEVAILFVYILQECCRVYFRFFEKWIFHGALVDPSGELFIEYHECRPKTKHFWDKAYQIKPLSVPGFLHGFEHVILLSGKYTMLLKEFRPNHPLLTADPPSLDVYMTGSQIVTLRTKCLEYSQRIQELCGQPISVRDLFRQYALARAEYIRLASTKQKENISRWMAEQETKKTEQRAEHARVRAILERQISEVHDRKVQQRIENLELDRMYLANADRIESERVAEEHRRRQKRIEYYTELGDLVEKQNQETLAKVAALKEQLVQEKAKTVKIQQELASAEGNTTTTETTNKISTTTTQKTSDVNENEVVELDTDNNLLVTSSILKKSPSDLLNANVGDDDAHEQASLNRMTQMGTTFDFHTHLTAVTTKPNTNTAAVVVQLRDDNSNETTTVTTEIDNLEDQHLSTITKPEQMMTDLQRNRQKVLTQEFGFGHSEDTTTTTTSNLNLIGKKGKTAKMTQQFDLFSHMDDPSHPPTRNVAKSYEEMSDLERNRQKVLSQEFGFATNDKIVPIKTTDQMTDPERNRQKILPQEFGLTSQNDQISTSKTVITSPLINIQITEDTKVKSPSSLCLNLIPSISSFEMLPNETPMSTGSDTPNKSIHDVLLEVQKPKLKLDISKATTASKLSFTNHCSTPSDIDQSVYETASAGFYTCEPGEGSIFRFPTTTSTPPKNVSKYLKELLPKGLLEFRKPAVQPATALDQSILEELSNPNISSITHSLRMSFVLPLQAQLNVLNNEILKVFLLDFNLIAHFKSLRNYFFMMDGEFASQICHGLLNKLENQAASPNEILNFSFLHSLLDNALDSSIMGNDPNAKLLSFIVEDGPPCFDLTSPNVMSVLKLTYAVEWPLNIFLNADTIAHYGMVFQHLLKLRRIRFALDETCQMLKEIGKTNGSKCRLSPQYRHVQDIRNKLLNFVNGLQNHITANALQASWRGFKTDLERAQSIEDIYQMHTRYLKRVSFLCLINNSSKNFNDMLDNVWVISLRFYHKLKRHEWKCGADGIYTHPKYQRLLEVETDFNKLVPYIVHTCNKMSRRGYQSEIGYFVNIINFNGYYDRDRK